MVAFDSMAAEILNEAAAPAGSKVVAAAAESKEVALASVSMAPARVSMVASGGAQGAALGDVETYEPMRWGWRVVLAKT